MSATKISLTSVWLSLGLGPLEVQVYTGTAVLQSSTRRPADADLSGTIVAATVGLNPTSLAGPGEWWAKAVVTGSVLFVTQTPAFVAPAPPAGGISSVAADGAGIAGLDVGVGTLLFVGPDGALRPASCTDANQFGLVAGFALAAAAKGTAVPFTRTDILTNDGWALKPGLVFVGVDGAVTQLEPTSGFVQVAGLAVSATTIVAGFGPPTLL